MCSSDLLPNRGEDGWREHDQVERTAACRAEQSREEERVRETDDELCDPGREDTGHPAAESSWLNGHAAARTAK